MSQTPLSSRIRTTSKGLRGFLRDGFDNFFEVLLPAHSWVRVEKGFSVLDTALRTGLSWLCVLVKGQFSASQIPSPHCLMNKSRSRNTSWRKQGPAAAMRSCYILLSFRLHTKEQHGTNTAQCQYRYTV